MKPSPSASERGAGEEHAKLANRDRPTVTAGHREGRCEGFMVISDLDVRESGVSRATGRREVRGSLRQLSS
jgi:hypothetical protein